MAMTLNFLFFKHSSAQSSEFSTSRQVPCVPESVEGLGRNQYSIPENWSQGRRLAYPFFTRMRIMHAGARRFTSFANLDDVAMDVLINTNLRSVARGSKHTLAARRQRAHTRPCP